MKRILCSLLVATLPFGSVLADAPKEKNAKVTLVYQHELPNVPGKSIKGVLVEYGPGGYSPGHTHPKSAFIYATVLEGAIRSQVNDGPVTTYKAGQSFSELPGDRHGVSANASKSKPAKLLAVFVVDTNETELTIPSGTEVLPFVPRYCVARKCGTPKRSASLCPFRCSPALSGCGAKQTQMNWLHTTFLSNKSIQAFYFR